ENTKESNKKYLPPALLETVYDKKIKKDIKTYFKESLDKLDIQQLQSKPLFRNKKDHNYDVKEIKSTIPFLIIEENFLQLCKSIQLDITYEKSHNLSSRIKNFPKYLQQLESLIKKEKESINKSIEFNNLIEESVRKIVLLCFYLRKLGLN